MAVTDEIQHGRCNVQKLALVRLRKTRSETTEAANAVASAIRWDCNLKHLVLQMENGLTDEAGVALAEALTVNKTLHKFTFSANAVFTNVPLPNTDELGASSYETFSAMLCCNTIINLKLPPFHYTGGDEKLFESRDQMIIEQRLNLVGRGRLLEPSNHTTREE
jgi:hypothetical protein